MSPSNSTGWCDRCALDRLVETLSVEYPLPEPVEYEVPALSPEWTTDALDALLAEPDLSALLEPRDCGRHG